MSGISKIMKKREDSRAPSDRPTNKEVWFKDGDQVFVTPIATGEENDTKLDEIYMYTFKNDDSRWTNRLQDENVDTSDVPSNIRPSHKFAFWGYVHEIIHGEKKNDAWEEVSGPGNRKLFKELVNDYRVIAISFGRSDYIWEQLVDIYNDWGSLNKGVMRIKRAGVGMYDTSYTLTATARASEIPDEAVSKADELPSIRGYFLERYGNAPSTNGKVSLDSISKDELF